MPTWRNIDCTVNTAGVVFAEHGVQRVGHGNTASCFIESQTGEEFEIRIRPTALPWEADGPKYVSPTWEQQRRAYIFERPRPKSPERKDRTDWHLSVSVYFDGSTQPAGRVLLLLDPNHPHFDAPDGEMVLRGGRTRIPRRSGPSRLVETRWVFSEVNTLEKRLRKLHVSDGSEGRDVTPDELETVVRNMAGLNVVAKETKMKAGKIEVVLERVLLVGSPYTSGLGDGVKGLNDARRPESEDNERLEGIDHSTATLVTSVCKAEKTNYTKIERVDDSEPPYASFVFMYRTAEYLKQFGFSNFCPAALISARRRESVPLPRAEELRFHPNRMDLAFLPEPWWDAVESQGYIFSRDVYMHSIRDERAAVGDGERYIAEIVRRPSPPKIGGSNEPRAGEQGGGEAEVEAFGQDRNLEDVAGTSDIRMGDSPPSDAGSDDKVNEEDKGGEAGQGEGGTGFKANILEEKEMGENTLQKDAYETDSGEEMELDSGDDEDLHETEDDGSDAAGNLPQESPVIQETRIEDSDGFDALAAALQKFEGPDKSEKAAKTADS